MIRFLILLAIRFLFIKSFLRNLVIKFNEQFPLNELDEKKKIELLCKGELEKINSGKTNPKIYKQPRGV